MAPDENKNQIPDVVDRIAGVIVIVALAILGVHGAYHPSTTNVVVVSALSVLPGVFQIGLLRWPEKWNRLATIVLGTAWTMLVALQASLTPAPEWIVLVQAGLGALACVFGVGLTALPGKGTGGPTGPAATVGLVFLLLVPSCGLYSTAWRTTMAIRDAAGVADKALAAAVDIEAQKCVADGKGTAETLPICVRATKPWGALVEWRATVRPAINSALVLTVASLQIAEQMKDKKLDWAAILKPAACALAKALEQWGDYLGGARGAILAATGAVKGTACP